MLKLASKSRQKKCIVLKIPGRAVVKILLISHLASLASNRLYGSSPRRTLPITKKEEKEQNYSLTATLRVVK